MDRVRTWIWWIVFVIYLVPVVVGIGPVLAASKDIPDDFILSSVWTAEGLRTQLDLLGWSPAFLIGIVLAIDLLILAVFLTVGLILYRRRHGNPFIWFSSLWLVNFGLAYSSAFIWGAERAVGFDISSYIAILSSMIWLGLFLFLMLFPDGRLRPGWMAVWPYVLLLLLLAITAGASFEDNVFIQIASLLILIVTLYTQVYKYRTTTAQVERQQVKWLIFVVFLNILSYFHEYFQPILVPSPANSLLNEVIVATVSGVMIATIPIGIGFAMLRYRLWDVDIVIRRTISYSILTGILALIYFGSVVVLQGIVTSLGGQQLAVVTVISTLGIAALFNPLREKVQDFIDLRFYRAKYDSERTLAEFASSARDEVQLERLAHMLIGVVHETIRPEKTSLWIKD